MDLTQTEKLHDLLRLGRDSNGTSDTDDQGNFGQSRDKKSTLSLGLATVGNGSVIGSFVFSVVLFRGSDGVLLILTLLLLGFVRSLLGLRGKLGLSGLLLED